MATPLFSTFSAVTELFVTAAVYTFLVLAYRKDRFLSGLLAFALTYEVLINVAYMVFRLFTVPAEAGYGPGMTTFLAFHGTLSLVMLIGLIAMSIAAIRQHKRGENLFREHPGMTWTFAVLWGVSIVTGEMIYVITYL